MTPESTGFQTDPHATAAPPVTDPFDTVPGGPSARATSLDTTVPYAATAAPSSLPRIGRYEILSEIARGGMGVVYKAFDSQLDRTVALKLIKSGELADADAIERFHTEAKAAAQLDHPGIVPVYEVGEFQGQHFLTMAFVDGHSLWQEVKESPLAPKRAAKLMQQVAEAIQFAHDRGIVHRDLKPQNILLTKDGQPKVTDFGLAKRREQDGSLTQTGQALGTPSYMPPEQAKGQIKEIGPLADVYSLGATLYCLLTGRPPFQAATQLETMLQVVEQDPVSPKSLNRAVSVDLETICLRCLEKEPAKRYATAQTLAEDLQRYLIGEPIAARPISRLERVLKWIARKPVAAAAYGLTALTAVLTVVGLTIAVFWRNAEVARGEAESARGEAESSRNEAVASKNEADSARDDALKSREEAIVARDGETQARKELEETKAYNQYLLNVRLAPTLWENGWVANARQALDECPPELRQWEWNYLNRQMHPELATLTGHPRRIGGIALSPDGSLLGSNSGAELRLWDVRTGKSLHVLTRPSQYQRPLIFTPDGTRLVTGDQDLIVWDVRRPSDPLSIAIIEQLHIVALDCSPDGTRLATTDNRGLLRLWEFTPQPVEITNPAAKLGGVARVKFTADSRRLITVHGNGTIVISDAVTGTPITMMSGHAARLNDMEVSSDGRRLVTAGDDGYAKVWDLDRMVEAFSLKIGPPGNNLINLVALDPTGTRLVTSAENDFSSRIWNAETGEPVAVLKGHRNWCREVAFSPDGQRVATANEDSTIRLWDASTGAELAVLRGHAEAVNQLLFSPDGTRLCTGSGDETVRIWDAVSTQSDPILPLTDFYCHGDFFPFTVSDGCDRAAWLCRDGTIRVADLLSGRNLSSWNTSPETVLDLAFSPDGTKVVVAGGVQSTQIREATTGETLATLTGHTQQVRKVAFSPDGRWIASAAHDGLVKIWDAGTGECRQTLSGHGKPVFDVVFSSDSVFLASCAYDNTVRVWNAADGSQTFQGACEYTAPTLGIRLASFSPDGLRLATPQMKEARLWELPAGRELALFEGHKSYVLNLTFSANGRWLTSSGWMKEIRVWDGDTGQPVATLNGHSNDVYAVHFSPDGRRLATASNDQTVRLWDTSSWQEIAALKGHTGEVRSVKFSPDGRRLISAAMDNTVRQWIAEESPTEIEMRRSAQLSAWRLEQLARAEEFQDWYAAAFHLNWLAKAQPDDVDLKARLQAALAQRDAVERRARTTPSADRPSRAVNFGDERPPAEWVLSIGGKLYVQFPGEANATLVDAVPERAFVISSIDFGGNEKLQPSDLKNLRGLAGLQGLALNHTKLEHDSLSLVGEMPHLTSCSLVGNGTGDEGLKALSQSRRLQWINLQDLPITDAALESLAAIEVPLTLYLTDCAVTGSGLHRMAGVPIQHLSICATKVQFADLPALVRDFPTLQSLDCRALGGEHGEGFAPLAQLTAFSSLTLDAQHLIAETDSLAKVSRLTSIGVSFQRTPIPPEAVEACGKIPQATSVSLAHSQLALGVIDALARNTTIQSLSLWHCAARDEDLEPVSRMPQLKSLQLHSPDITPAGIERFRQLRPDVELNANDQNYPAMKPGK